MGVAAYNRGTRAMARQFEAEAVARRASFEYWATYEVLPGGLTAIVELTRNGEWEGGGKIEVNNPDDLRDAAYRNAFQRAAVKGGYLGRFARSFA